MGSSRGSAGKISAYNGGEGDIGDTGLIPGSGGSPGGGTGNSLQYPCPKIPVTEEPGGLQWVAITTKQLSTAHQSK